jgi:GTP-binding protein HflX
VIAHVRDAAHDESAAQKQDVLAILAELGVPEARPILEVLNKTDLLPPGPRAGLEAQNGRSGAYAVSALTGHGIPALLAGFEAAVTHGNIAASLKLDAEDGEALAFAYRHAQVVERRERAGKIRLTLRIAPQDRARFERRYREKMQFIEAVEAKS